MIFDISVIGESLTFTTPLFYIFICSIVLCVFSPPAVLLATLAHIQTWFCSSVDLIDSVLNASPYCTLSGI